ncbi:endonuclease [Rhodohalobacter sp. SW132]|uniref:endonuclease/exonuclease/phosphatase family protein n=1 Tax=Rhodohalobacter sp. SW132 TaxID=2293433 RepID=UPI000E243E11|nr:endonuclease/exonuclease/phosphatase family protein [Rhodohalobacter sp. SW132]REL38979.1 endonuclease [Rhodohalobacter sp. SW132]
MNQITTRKMFLRLQVHNGVCVIVYSAVLLFLLAGFSTVSAQPFNISSYNIFYFTPAEHENSWESRKHHVASVIRFHDIVLWGSQEGEHNQLQDLRQMLGQEYIGFSRDDGDTEGEHSAIFYNPDLFRVIEHDTFWLSKTPDRPSMDWGVNFHRICTWGKFEHLDSGKEFYVYNVHFDHESQEARENSSRMILEHIEENTPEDAKIIFLGDLNAEPDNKAYKKVIDDGRFQDTYHISNLPPHGPTGTFNGFSFTREPDRRIDYIFLTNHFEVNRYGVLTDSYDGLNYPSDHFPVIAEIKFNSQSRDK